MILELLLTDRRIVLPLLEPYSSGFVGTPLDKWLEDSDNIVILDEEDVFLFEYVAPSVYQGHYFCKSRGREVIAKSQLVLEYLFNEKQVVVIRGLTPIENKPARWLSRHLGFTSYGEIETIAGPAELFILTKQEWISKNG